MTEETALVPADVVDDRRRKAALLRAIGLDKVPPEQRDLAIAIADKYDLDLMLKHLVLVDGRPYVTRDGLLWIAHRSGVFDGLEVTEPRIAVLAGVGEFWVATATVYRRDMSHPFTYSGRYPTKGGNQRYGPEMAVKTAESMALRRAFNVSAATIDERWDLATTQADVDAVSVPQQPPRTLAERVQERRPTPQVTAGAVPAVDPDEDDEATQSMGVARMTQARYDAELDRGISGNNPAPAGNNPAPEADLVSGLEDELICGDEDVSPMALGFCELLPGHKGHHKSDNGTWT